MKVDWRFGYDSLWSLFGVVLALITLFVVGIWGSARRGEAERREWAIEVFLGGLCGTAMVAVDSMFRTYAAFESADYFGPGAPRGSNASLLFVPAEGLFAIGAVMAGAIVIAWATRSRPAWGPWVPFLAIAAAGVALWILQWTVPLGGTPSVSYRIDRSAFEQAMAGGGRVGGLGSLGAFLAYAPWAWHSKVDRILAWLLPAVVVLCGRVARDARRRREACVDRERGELRESLAALGLLLLCLSVMRLTFLAEERIACVAVYREHLLTTNTELLLDWLRVGWFPILAAAFGLGVAVFAWLRLRPTEAGDHSPGLEGAPCIPASRP